MGRIRAPSARMLGTKVPIKIPANLSSAINQIHTERAIEIAAARIISQRAYFVVLSGLRAGLVVSVISAIRGGACFRSMLTQWSFGSCHYLEAARMD